MSINLILGSTGKGKTYQVIEKIKDNVKNKQKCILLVPEQQTFNTEMNLQKKLGDKACQFLTVTNFSRLAEETLHKLGNASLKQLDRGVNAVCMWKVLRNMSDLKYYKASENLDNGYVNKMLDTIIELSSLGFNEAKLNASAEKIREESPLLADKLNDLANIYAKYTATKKDAFEKTTEDFLSALAEKLASENLFENTIFYLDSFVGFTENQYAVIEALHKNGNQIFVTICADEIAPKQTHLKGIADTITRLKKICGSLTDTIHVDYENNKSVPAQLAEMLWDFSLSDGKKDFSEQAKDKVVLLKAGCLYDECEAVARTIADKHKNGVDYKNMAIFLRNADTYKGILDRVLESHNIPYFLSVKTDFSSHILYRFIMSTLSCILYNYKFSDVLTLVKTGLFHFSDREICDFESYARTWHITNGGFAKVWQMNSQGFKEAVSKTDIIKDNAEKVRKKVYTAVSNFAEELKKAKSCKEQCKALYEYLEKNKIEEKLKEKANKEMEENPRLVGEEIRFYLTVVNALIKLSDLFKDSKIDEKEFAKVFDLLISSEKIAFVPTEDDAVTIGSADLIRVEDVKVSIIMGLHEGEFPASVRSNTLFTQKEKDDLSNVNKANIPFVKSEVAMAQELFYLYRAVAKSNDFLLMTYALGSNGDKSQPSMAYNRVKTLLSYKENGEIVSFPEYVFIDTREVNSEEKENVNAPWDVKTLELSPSSVANFAKCPFFFFIANRLHLNDEKDGNADVSDDGTFMHALFQNFFGKYQSRDDYPSDDVIDKEADEFANDYLEKIMKPDEVEPNIQVLHTFKKQKTLYKKLLKEMVGDLRSGKFQPTLFEQRIQNGGNFTYVVPFVAIDGSTGNVSLKGFVDRIDTYTDDSGKKWFRVIDYKSGGKHEYNEEKLQKGEDIQLFAYCFPIDENGTWGSLAGAEFLVVNKEDKNNIHFQHNGFCLDDVNVKDEFIKDDPNKSLKKATVDGHKGVEPVFTQVKIDELKKTFNNTLEKSANGIVGADATNPNTKKNPSSDNCSFCPMKNYCHKAEKGGF